MIRKNLRKQFIYKLLREDLYGEFSLRKAITNRFTMHLLVNIWLYISDLRSRYFDKLKAFRKVIPRFRRIAFNVLGFVRARSEINLVKRLTRYENDTFHFSRLPNVYKLDKKRPSSVLRGYVAFNSRKHVKTLYRKNKISRLFSLNKNYFYHKKNKPAKASLYYSLWHRDLASLYRSTGKHFDRVYPSRRRLHKNRRQKKRGKYEVRTFFENLVKPRKTRKIVQTLSRKQTAHIRNAHTLRFFNLVTTTGDFLKPIKNFANMPLNNKHFTGNFMSFAEGRLASVLLRSGFFENGYITSNIVKRGPFLINGFPSKFPLTILQAWDCITVSKPLWWYVYARMLTFVKKFNKTILDKNAISARRPYKPFQEKEALRIRRLRTMKSPIRLFFFSLLRDTLKESNAVLSAVTKNIKNLKLPRNHARSIKKKWKRKVAPTLAYLRHRALAKRRYRFRKLAKKVRKNVYSHKPISLLSKDKKKLKKRPIIDFSLHSPYRAFSITSYERRKNRFYRFKRRSKKSRRRYKNNYQRFWYRRKRKKWFPTYKQYRSHLAFKKLRDLKKRFAVSRVKIKLFTKMLKHLERKKIKLYKNPRHIKRYLFRRKKNIVFNLRSGSQDKTKLLGKTLVPVKRGPILYSMLKYLRRKLSRIRILSKFSLKVSRFQRARTVKPMRPWKVKRKARFKALRRANSYVMIVPAAPYMEISYKIFSLIMFRLPHKAIDTNLSTSIRLINRFSKRVDYSFKRLVFPHVAIPREVK